MRTGWIQEGWKTCDSEILQVAYLSFILALTTGNSSFSNI